MTTTIVAVAGVSHSYERKMPRQTETISNDVANANMPAGLLASNPAEEGGRINMALMSKAPTYLMAMPTLEAISKKKKSLVTTFRTPSASARFGIQGQSQQRTVNPPQAQVDEQSDAEDFGDVVPVGQKNLAQQERMQIGRTGTEQGKRQDAQSQGSVGENSQVGIRTETPLVFQRQQQNAEGKTDRNHRNFRLHADGYGRRKAQQGAVGEGVAKVGQPAPHDETTERSGQQGDADPACQSRQDEIGKEAHSAGSRECRCA